MYKDPSTVQKFLLLSKYHITSYIISHTVDMFLK